MLYIDMSFFAPATALNLQDIDPEHYDFGEAEDIIDLETAMLPIVPIESLRENKAPTESREVLTDNLERILKDWRKSDRAEIIIERDQYTTESIVDAMTLALNRFKAVMVVNDNHYVLNNTTKNRLRDYLARVKDVERTESDAEVLNMLDAGKTVIIKRYITEKKQRPAGAFYNRINLTDFDFSDLQIYKSEEEMSEKLKENCLIKALKEGGVNSECIRWVKTVCKTRKVPMKDLHTIAEGMEIIIHLKKYIGGRIKTLYYGKKNLKAGENRPIIKIGLINDHYFAVKNVDVTAYALKNKLPVTDFDVVNASGRREKKRMIDSVKAVRLLTETPGLTRPINSNFYTQTTSYYSEVDNFIDLNYNEKEVKEIKNPPISNIQLSSVFFDFETIPQVAPLVHIPFIAHYYNPNNPNKIYEFHGADCATQMLNSLETSTVLYAHNAGYDYRFIIDLPDFRCTKIIKKGDGILMCKGRWRNRITIVIKDTLKLIPMPLRKFGKCFKIEQKKELMPYSLQTVDLIDKQFLTKEEIEKADELQTEEDKKTFYDNCREWNCEIAGKIDIVKYASKYCRLDCVVLAAGFDKFRRWMKEAIDIDIYEVSTIPGLVHRYFIDEGCYEGVKQLSGVSRAFIQKCVVGGRTMMSNNKKTVVIDKINDFDAVSLYPSAMKRMKGFLKGSPKVLNNLSYYFLKEQDGYFVKIEITKINKHRAFPLSSEVINGVRTFNNNPKVLFIDKIALEDLIKYQDIEFNIIQGYYFNEGYNIEIRRCIDHLFKERLKKKNEGNPAQVVYKLLMNSSYGMTLLKPISTDDKVFNDSKTLNTYIAKNFDFIKEFTQIGKNTDKWALKAVKPINNHFNVCHVGVEILSMSKRIMNEVMCLAEDHEIPIYYQDTDSMHILDKDIKTLESLYKEEYKRDLVGTDMGQFHSDFDKLEKDGKKPHSVKLITLGKKCYLDKLSDGKNTGYHMRMKGVPNRTVKYTAKINYDGDVEKLYMDLYNGKKVKFDLTEGGTKACFRGQKNLTITTIKDFTRELSF